MITKIIKEYKISVEDIRMHESEEPVIMASIYATDGGYVGTTEDFARLFERGILPEIADKNNKTCSIGKSFKDGKWYGWSHRAICGFEIGDKAEEGSCCVSSGFSREYLKDHPEEDKSLPIGFEAKTEEDAKKMAIAFADSVS